MPRIHKRDLQGKTQDELLEILQRAADDGSYSRSDIEKVLAKLRKRITQGERDEAMLNDIFNDLNITN
jgi:ParB-like chromosome segregation protein Spo0J